MLVTAHPLLRCFGFYRRHPGLLVAAIGVALLVNLSLPLKQHFIRLAIDEVQAGGAVVRLPDGALDLSRANRILNGEQPVEVQELLIVEIQN